MNETTCLTPAEVDELLEVIETMKDFEALYGVNLLFKEDIFKE